MEKYAAKRLHIGINNDFAIVFMPPTLRTMPHLREGDMLG